MRVYIWGGVWYTYGTESFTEAFMDRQAALGIIGDNYNARGESFLFYMHERDLFSREKFDELCESIEALGGGQRDTEVLWMLTRIESAVLKELIYHFNEEDSLQIEGVPWDYLQCLERLDGALHRYYYSGK